MSRGRRTVSLIRIWPRALLAAGLGLMLSGCLPAAMGSGTAQDAARSAVRVTATRQGYQFHRPWQAHRPTTIQGIGAVIAGGRVLVTSELVANHRYIELETIDSRKKCPARVVVTDYEANLALVEPVTPGCLVDRIPLDLARESAKGDAISVWQVTDDGEVLPIDGTVASVELTPFAHGNQFLAYQFNRSLQYRSGNVTLPVVRGNRLVGLVLREQRNDQITDIVATPVIRHFLNGAAQRPYQGFPLAGFRYEPLVDPQLRTYLGFPENRAGVYVASVIKGGPMDQAGVQSGDVITAIGPRALSNTGHFEHPVYGPVPLAYLIRCLYPVGATLPVTLFRNGRTHMVSVTLDHRDPDEYLVPPYFFDRQPPHLIIGGLVIQELMVPYLREYGKDWNASAPIHLLFYNQNQDYLNGDAREKIVILSMVIPTAHTVGYERIADRVILKVNDRPIGRLADVAAALAAPVNGFHKFELDHEPRFIYLNPAHLDEIDQIITERYRIPIPPLPR